MTIRLRLTLWYSGLLAVALMLLCGSIYFFTYYNSYGEVHSRLEAGAKELLEESRGVWGEGIHLNRLTRSSIQSELYVQLVNMSDKNIVDKSNNMLSNNLQFPIPNDTSLDDAVYRKVKADGYPFMLCEITLVSQSTNEKWVVQIGAFTGSQADYLYDLRNILIISSLAAVIIAFTIGMFLARQALRPIENVIQASRKIETGSDLTHRIPRESPNDEIGRLTDTLNGMLGRMQNAYNELDEAYNSQRRFVSDASHELRTPLTTIRGNIELLERMWRPALEPQDGKVVALSEEEADRQAMTREAMRDIAEEAIRMSRLVNDLLSLARADAGFVMEKSNVELMPIVEDVCRRAQHLPRKAEWIIGDYSQLQDVRVYGNPDFLRQLLFIFIENAFKYTPSGTVELTAIRQDDRAGIVVRDTGIGMKGDEVPKVFDRFYRADVSRGKTSGTGLGLSIAKWIIDEHNGFVEVTTREEEGSTFTVWLPVAFSRQHESGIME
ncbi:integral membrane sensor signal transduction histidine kinase [Paenibacillus curdlanolyticus YK9]|uniref:histidine kinase n=1 Tax=Paenibacillus curdlanolyticus YK9 TaxID=717606 RepID=E0IBF5_9BACL|nr:sensor histidine kinase [Paenibacillus curdlanolyticus]EFM10035.1 integral membrane sensor signal transduction histidine kinase [Paenibacillus curdlanolyticus YK9]